MQAERIRNVPLWMFHGVRDEVVPVQQSRNMILALKNLKAPVKYTEYNTLGHSIWQETYYSPAFMTWLFAQHKN